MKRKRHSAEQVVTKLREAEAMLTAGASMAQVCQRLEISEATIHRWQNPWGLRPQTLTRGAAPGPRLLPLRRAPAWRL